MLTDTMIKPVAPETDDAPGTDGSETCCPVFDPEPFQDAMHAWHDRPFAKAEMRAVMHVPVGMNATVRRLVRLAEAAGALPADRDRLMLLHDPSPWKSELHLAVDRDVPGATMVQLSGTFYSKVFDGPYHDAPKWMAATEAVLAQRGEEAQRHYLHYAYCPSCASKYGHNFVVDFAQVA